LHVALYAPGHLIPHPCICFATAYVGY
jgi:hypothetical protein